MQSPPRRVVVLGGTGLLGSATAAAFCDLGADVVVVARHPLHSAAKARRLQGCTTVNGDAASPTLLAEVLEGAEHVVYSVGTSLPAESNANPARDIEQSLPPLINLLEALRERPGIGLTYYSSGGTVYGEPARLPVTEDEPCNPITSYGVTRLASEKYVGMYSRLYGIPSRVLRIANAYGPFQEAGRSQGVIASFLAAVRDGRPVRLFGDGEVRRDYVQVSDIARATVALAAIGDGPLVVNVGTGVGHSLNELLDMVQRVTSLNVDVEHFASRHYDVRSLVLDVSRLRELIEWDPVPMEEGIASTWKEFAAIARSSEGPE